MAALPQWNCIANAQAPRAYSDGRLTFTRESRGGRAVREASGTSASSVACVAG
jgi:hypothetical protein